MAHVKNTLSILRSKRILLLLDLGILKEAVKTNLVTFFLMCYAILPITQFYPITQFCLEFLTNESSQASIFIIHSSQIYSLSLKCIKTACLDHFFRSDFYYGTSACT